MNNQSDNYLTFEADLQDPTLAHLHEVIHFLEKNDGTILFPKKYKTGLKSLVSRDINRLFQEKSTMPIAKVVATILDTLNDKLPSDMVLEITQFIIEKWENLSVETRHKRSVLQTI